MILTINAQESIKGVEGSGKLKHTGMSREDFQESKIKLVQRRWWLSIRILSWEKEGERTTF